MYTNVAKNPLRTYLGLNREKNKNIKASPKKKSSCKKCIRSVKRFQSINQFATREKDSVGTRTRIYK